MKVKADDKKLPIILIGNKNDSKTSRKISTEEATDLANKWCMQYIETSAKNNKNVEKAFNEIFIKIKEQKAREATALKSKSEKKDTKRNCLIL